MPPAQILPAHDPQSIHSAILVLSAGGLVCFPTDTVYGLAARLDNPTALERIYSAKGRANTKALAVLVGSIDQLALVTPGLTTSARQLALHFWPGALTLVVPRLLSSPLTQPSVCACQTTLPRWLCWLPAAL
jgi:L-threonylcarbamoyladenylate synthase